MVIFDCYTCKAFGLCILPLTSFLTSRFLLSVAGFVCIMLGSGIIGAVGRAENMTEHQKGANQ